MSEYYNRRYCRTLYLICCLDESGSVCWYLNGNLYTPAQILFDKNTTPYCKCDNIEPSVLINFVKNYQVQTSDSLLPDCFKYPQCKVLTEQDFEDAQKMHKLDFTIFNVFVAFACPIGLNGVEMCNYVCDGECEQGELRHGLWKNVLTFLTMSNEERLNKFKRIPKITLNVYFDRNTEQLSIKYLMLEQSIPTTQIGFYDPEVLNKLYLVVKTNTTFVNKWKIAECAKFNTTSDTVVEVVACFNPLSCLDKSFHPSERKVLKGRFREMFEEVMEKDVKPQQLPDPLDFNEFPVLPNSGADNVVNTDDVAAAAASVSDRVMVEEMANAGKSDEHKESEEKSEEPEKKSEELEEKSEESEKKSEESEKKPEEHDESDGKSSTDGIVDTLKKLIDALKQQIDALQQQNVILQQQNSSLQCEVNALKQQIDVYNKLCLMLLPEQKIIHY